MRVWSPVGVILLFGLFANALVAQEAQKGRSEARTEMSRQIQNSGVNSLEVQMTRAAMKRMHQRNLMTPMESSDAFRSLDRNGDRLLSRSELPAQMPLLRAQFDRYDLNGDHRLTYSEFANYTDVVPNELARHP